jgi:hypothetical protein
MTSLLVMGCRNLATGLALKVIGDEKGKRKRDRLEELERDIEILKKVLQRERKPE